MKFSSSIYVMVVLTILLVDFEAKAQSISIKEESLSLSTYGFEKPNPVPILTNNPKIYPYCRFEEYDPISKKKTGRLLLLKIIT